jgi:hypothetical protein
MKGWYYKDEENNVALQHFCLHLDPLHSQQQTSIEVPCLQITADLARKSAHTHRLLVFSAAIDMRFLRE